MKRLSTLLAVIAVCAAAITGQSAAELYDQALNFAANDNTPAAREAMLRCLVAEKDTEPNYFRRRNVDHWLYEFGRRTLSLDSINEQFHFTPQHRDSIAPYLHGLDQAYVSYSQKRPDECLGTLRALADRALADPKLNDGYRAEIFLQLNVFETEFGAERTAIPLLKTLISPDLGMNQRGLALVSQFWANDGTGMFEYLPFEAYESVCSEFLVANMLYAGNINETISWWDSFCAIAEKAFDSGSYEHVSIYALGGLMHQYVPNQVQEMARLLEKLAETKQPADRCVQIFEMMYKNNRVLNPENDSARQAGEKKAMDYARRNKIAGHYQVLKLLAEDCTDRVQKRKYLELARKDAKKRGASDQDYRNILLAQRSAAIDDLDFDKALEYSVECDNARSQADINSSKLAAYIRISFILSQKPGMEATVLELDAKYASETARIYGAKSLEYAKALVGLTREQIKQSQFSAARTNYYKIIEIAKAIGIDPDSINGFNRNSLGHEIHTALGLPWEEVAPATADLELIKQKHGRLSEEYARALETNFDILFQQRKYRQCIEIVREQIDIDQTKSGIFHNPTNDLILIANLEYFENPTPEEAAGKLEIVEGFWKNSSDPKVLETLRGARDGLAILDAIKYFASVSGQYSKATDAALERYKLLETKSWLGNSLDTLDDIVRFASYANEYGTVRTYMPVYMETLRTTVLSQIIGMTEEERNAFWPPYAEKLNMRTGYANFRSGTNDFAGAAFDAALLNKGLLLQSGRAIDRALDSHPELRRRLADLAAARAKGLEIDFYTEEKEILAGLASETDWGRYISTTWADVAAALPDSTVAVEFVAVNPYPHTRYGAVAVEKGGKPVFVPLFAERFLPSGDSQYRFMSDSIWAPLVEAFPQARSFCFSPVGELCRRPLEAAFVPDSDTLVMADVYRLRRLSSTRQLIHTPKKRKASTQVLYGGLAYDMTAEEMVSDSYRYPAVGTRRTFDGLRAAHKLKPLPGTLYEAQGIAEQAKWAKVKCNLLTGALGTESSFKALTGKSPAIIHVATHGFYWTERQAAFMPQMKQVFAAAGSAEERSLSRSGLMMAGADLACQGMEVPQGCDDGILTALEIADLDLSGTDLVVLSACQTGLGDISGEGVFGLQRGFKKAGAGSLVMSLWSVSDDATAMLMGAFYRALYAGKSKAEALRMAQHQVRTHSQCGGCEPRWTHPRYWAAFVLLD